MEEITREEAIKIAEAYLAAKSLDLVLSTRIDEKTYGWVFYYNSKIYRETGDMRHALIGNAPFLVEKKGGKIVVLGTAHGVSYYLANYERTGNPRPQRPHQPGLFETVIKWLFKK